MSEKNVGRVVLVLTALLYGLAGVCVKSITWSPLSIAAFRSAISFVVLWVYKRKINFHLTKVNIMGALGTSAAGILYIMAIKLTTAGTAIVLEYIAPILVFVYAVVFQKKKAKPHEVLLTFLVFFGCFLSFADNIELNHILGNALALLSGVAYAVQLIVLNRKDCNKEETLMMANIITFIICLPFAFFDSTVSFDAKNLTWLMILAVFQYGFANIFLSKGLERVDKIEASLILTIEPIFNPIPVAIICHETMGPLAIAGAIVVIACATMYVIFSED